MIKYDLVIPTAPKDFNKSKFCIESAIQYLIPQPEKIFVIAPIDTHTATINDKTIHIINEQEVLNLDPKACKNFHRSEWIYCHFLKMFQDYTPEQDYLIVDADLIFNREFKVFNQNNQRQFFLGVDQNHRPYFNFMEKFLGFGREYPHSFISEVMLFHKPFCKELAQKYGGIESLYSLCSEVICEQYLTADYEIYGNYVYKYHSQVYDFQKIKTHLTGKYIEWTDEEILELKDQMNTQDYDTFTYHTWI